MTTPHRQKIAVVAGSENLASDIESTLRNSGAAVRADWVSSVDALVSQFGREDYDLVLCDSAMSSAMVKQVISTATRSAPYLPVVVLVDNLGETGAASVTEALREGAATVVAADHPVQIELVCKRELAIYAERMQIQDLKSRAAQADRRARAVLRESGEPMSVVQEGIVVDTNLAFSTLIGKDPQDLIATPLLDHFATADQSIIKEKIKRSARDDAEQVSCEARMRSDNGLTLPQRIELRRVVHDDEPAVRLQIRRPPSTDAPPSEPRRAELLQTLTHLDSTADGYTHGVALVAIDQFDEIEQRIGYFEAEQALNEVSKTIGPVCSPGDQLFRFSVSELVIVARRDSPEALKVFAQTLHEKVRGQIINTENHETSVSITAIAYALSGDETPQHTLDLLRGGVAKHAEKGGNTAAFIGPQAEESERKRVAAQLAERIETSLEKDRLRLVYQPIASLEGGEGRIYDSHVRMFDDQGQEFTATEFLPVAIEFGLMPQIDRWVCKTAVQALADDDANQAVVFLRVSRETLAEPKLFVQDMLEELVRLSIPPERLVLEIPERVLNDHRGKATTMLKVVSQAGISLAIDRFGVGQHSLQLLNYFTPSFIKLDPSFTRALTGGSADQKHAQFREIIEAAHEKNIKTIAEHIEDANGMAKLWQLGINYVQGNHVLEPEVVLGN